MPDAVAADLPINPAIAAWAGPLGLPEFGKITEAAGKEPIQWVAPGSGPKSLSNLKLKDAGFVFGDADASKDGTSFL